MSLTREDRTALSIEANERELVLRNRPAEALPAIVRCRIKGCKSVRRVFVLVRRDVKVDWHWGRVSTTRKVTGYDDGHGNRLDVHGFTGVPCLPCGHKMTKVAEVEGTYSDRKTCDARCVNAVGPSCECSCGGMSHGAGHSH